MIYHIPPYSNKLVDCKFYMTCFADKNDARLGKPNMYFVAFASKLLETDCTAQKQNACDNVYEFVELSI